MTTTVSTPREVATRLYDAFDAGDVGAVDTLFDPALVDHNPTPGAPGALDAMRALIAAVRDAFTDAHHELGYQAEIGDGWVVTNWVMTGRQTGAWFGTPPSNREVSFAGIDLVRVVDARITEIRHVEQLLQLQAQIAP